MDDVEKIKKLKARYFRTLDTKDWTAFREVFADDFVSDTTPSGGLVIRGADDFVAFVSRTLNTKRTVHHGHMPEIEMTSVDTATGTWAMEDLVHFAAGVEMHGYGHYHEEYKMVDGQWRISYSRLARLRMDVRLFFVSMKIPEILMKRMAERSTRK